MKETFSKTKTVFKPLRSTDPQKKHEYTKSPVSEVLLLQCQRALDALMEDNSRLNDALGYISIEEKKLNCNPATI